MVADSPSDLVFRVLDRLAGLGHIQDEDALASEMPLLDGRSDVNTFEDPVTEPFDVQFGAGNPAGVVHAEDESATARRVRHARHLTRQLFCRLGALAFTGKDVAPAVAAAGFLLEIHLLSLLWAQDPAGLERGEDFVNLCSQPGTRLNKITVYVEQRHVRASRHLVLL